MRRWPRFLPSPHREVRIDERWALCGPIRAGLFRVVFGLWVAGILPLARPAPASGSSVQDTQAEDQRTVWDGVYSAAQAERGQALYRESCSSCHAPDLRGDNTSPSLVGMSFTFLWGGSTLGALFEGIRERMPPVRPGTLTAQSYRDILAFVLAKNGYPSGGQELEGDHLDYIIISAQPDDGR